MQIINVKDTGLAQVEKMLVKPAFDQVELNPKIREANKKLFGKDMTAAEIVEMIASKKHTVVGRYCRRGMWMMGSACFSFLVFLNFHI